ncbi:MAG TPA: hypothetical protein PKV11_09255 [Smithella sp.]|nr:hypothetical protein [Smithella sp.]
MQRRTGTVVVPTKTGVLAGAPFLDCLPRGGRIGCNSVELRNGMAGETAVGDSA